MGEVPLQAKSRVRGSSQQQSWGAIDFLVDFDLLDRIVGVSACHSHERIGSAILAQTYEQRTPPVVQ